MKEPTTDQELADAIRKTGHDVIEDGEGYSLVNRRGGGSTMLDGETLSDALFEAWALVNGERI